MREVTIKLYRFEELSQEVQDKIVKRRIENTEVQDLFCVHEFRDTFYEVSKALRFHCHWAIDVHYSRAYNFSTDIQFENREEMVAYIEEKIQGEYPFTGVDYDEEFKEGVNEALRNGVSSYLNIMKAGMDKLLTAVQSTVEGRFDPEYVKEEMIERGDEYTEDGSLF